jgi:hypothetical protein
MATYDCDDFRVSFEHVEGDSYSATARAVDGRQVLSTFRLPMTSELLEESVLQLGRSRSREVAPEMETARRANAEELGGALGTALFGGDIGPLYDDARRSAAVSGRGLRLTLSLASTPELLSVPWELLYRRPTFLASQRRTPVVRYLEVGDPPPPARIDGPVRVLGVVASPTGLPELNVADERARVERALAGMKDRGLVELDWCDPATPRSLRERLRDGSYDVLHYVGHSDFTGNGDGLLFLVDEAGGAAQVTESVLTNLLGDQTSLRLAVLNSCEGARTTLTDPFAGIATSLVALGVPAVVAMQFTISDRAAIVFAEELFTSLIGRQYPIDAAVSEARKAVFTEVNEIEWATPVLFLRSADGQLFDFRAEPVALPLPVAPTPIVVDELPVAGAADSNASTGAGTTATVASPASPADREASSAASNGHGHPPRSRSTARRRWGAAALVGVVAAACVIVAILWAGGQDADDGVQLQLSPSSGPAGTSIEIHGDECPTAPDNSVDTGIAYWLDSDLDGTITSDDVEDGDAAWTGNLVVPDDSSTDASYQVGAACYATDNQGDTANFFEYPTVSFDVI